MVKLVSTGKYDVRVAAPSEEQSAKAHSITIHGLLNVEKLILPDPLSHIVAWQVPVIPNINLKNIKNLVLLKITGTPADSVKIALNTQLWDGWTPDLVISGRFLVIFKYLFKNIFLIPKNLKELIMD